jgi:hypothetical protein
MKATSLFLAAAFVLGANAAFAQTTPTTGTTSGTTTSGTTSGTTTSGTMNQTPSSGTMNNGSMNSGTMNNGNGTGTMGTGTGTDAGSMRSNRRMNKGSKMKSKSTDGTSKSTM